jgi:hypothetical protein
LDVLTSERHKPHCARYLASVPEVSSALLIPDLAPPAIGRVLALALIWDRIEWPNFGGPQAAGPAEDWEAIAVDALEEARVLARVVLSLPGRRERPSPRIPRYFTRPELVERFLWLADETASWADAGLDRCRQRGLAPVAITPFSQLCTALPADRAGGPIVEATLIMASVAGIELSPDTDVDSVLRFRTRHRKSIGRYRATLIDLAGALSRDVSYDVMAEEARSIIRNRIEPVLGDLDSALKENRIAYTLKALTGASGIAKGAATIASAGVGVGAGAIGLQALSYSLSRRHLVDRHPLGLLHQISREFPTRSGQVETNRTSPREGGAITDPVAQLRGVFVAMAEAAWGDSPSNALFTFDNPPQPPGFDGLRLRYDPPGEADV